MRKSVERTNHFELSRHHRQHRLLRRALLWITVPLVAILCGLFILLSAQAEQASSAQLKDNQAKYNAEMDRKIAAIKEQKRIEAARAAEAAAKAKAEEEAAKQKAEAIVKPSGTTAAATCDVTRPDSITVVVNKKHCFSPITWAPGDLASVNGYLLRAEAAGQLQQLMAAAVAAGLGFDLSSAYRSYSDQQVTYNNWVRVNGSQAAADTVSARPGYSEHQTGLAADLKVGGCALECFANTAQYTWLTQHAANYGFIQRYPVGLTSITGYSPEAWHWRYVGVATATDMKAKGIQTLEQYFGITGGDY
ncbi:MAG: M15 family metallopeptidase [Candidatus Saccharimonas sp.]